MVREGTPRLRTSESSTNVTRPKVVADPGPDHGPDPGSTYSPFVALVYVFNLVVGTGALALPSVLTSGGWYLGGLFLLIVACASYIAVTFMIEAMAAANAVLYLEKKEMFFTRWGRVFFYAALILYLFGDVAIYCTFIPRSLVGFMYGNTPPPWAFDAFLAGFIVLIVPFCFFDFQKTKLLQFGTMAIRNAALFTIMVLATWAVWKEGPRSKGVPNFRLQALPNLFGGAVYAFMCHHSLPGIITPMRDKAKIPQVTRAAFVGVFVIYMLLFITCGVAFGLKAEDPITFNFPPEKYGITGDMLFLFPVFTLSSSFPMLSITLRNNLDTLLLLVFPTVSPSVKDNNGWRSESGPRRQTFVTLLAVGPPIACCVWAEHAGWDVTSLVGLTGAYAGAAVMFIIPAALVHCSRIVTCQRYPTNESDPIHGSFDSHPNNIHASPFRGVKWVVSLILMALLAITFITWERYTLTEFVLGRRR